jgi:hypothetical protein
LKVGFYRGCAMLLAHPRRVNSESRDRSFTGPYHADRYGLLGFEDVAERG